MSAETKPRLLRAVSGPLLFVFVVGDVLGAGIYALVGEVGSEVGGAIWASFTAALVLAMFTAGSYAELTTKYPHAGGAALYAGRAFRSSTVEFLVAFAVLASGVTSASTLARAFAGDYLGEFAELPVVPVAIVFVLAIALVNFGGVLRSLRLNLVLTGVELGGLLLIAVIGAAAVIAGGGDPGRALEFESDPAVPLAILSGASIAFYALIGFEDSVNLAEETREPTRMYPRVLLGGLVAAGLVYAIVSVTASMAVPTGELASSNGPLLEVAERGPLAVPPKLFSAIALLAIANGALINMIMVSRLLYGMSEEGVVSGWLGRVDPVRRSPWAAIVVSTAIAVVLIATGDLRTLAETTVVLLLIVFIVVNLSVLLLRREAVPHRHFRVPAGVPVLGVASCALVLSQTSAAALARAGAVALLGIAVWGVQRLVRRTDAFRARG